MKERNGEHPFGDAGQIILFVLFMIVWVADSFWLEISTFPAASIPLFIRVIIAVVVLIIALMLAKSGHVVAGKENDPGGVVSSGAFGYVRHPLYLGSLLFYVCLTVFTASLLEKLLVSRYGDEYSRYKRNTGKWVPKVGKVRSKSRK